MGVNALRALPRVATCGSNFPVLLTGKQNLDLHGHQKIWRKVTRACSRPFLVSCTRRVHGRSLQIQAAAEILQSFFPSTARNHFPSHTILRGRLHQIKKYCNALQSLSPSSNVLLCVSSRSTFQMAETPKARGANFGEAELNQLVASWLHISQDSIVGSAQKNGAFWDRTVKYYNEHRPLDKEIRKFRSLESKGADLKKDVARFAGCYQNIVDQRFSGDSLEDTLRKAWELYVVKDLKGKEFMYIGQWYLLKECPRFAMSIDDMNQKAAQLKARKQKGKGRRADKENEVPNFSGIVDVGDDEPQADPIQSGHPSSDESLHYGEKRPMGNKVAKLKRSDESAAKIMASAQRDMAITSAKRLKLAEKLAERQDRDSLLTMRVEDIDEECRAYFKACRAKELRIAMLKL